jgi:hypothetical protein
MTKRWTKADNDHIDALLAKFPPTEIAAKARERGRGPGRPKYHELYDMIVFLAVEFERHKGVRISVAADRAAERISRQWKKPVKGSTLINVHRACCQSLGIKPKDAGAVYSDLYWRLKDEAPTLVDEARALDDFFNCGLRPLDPTTLPTKK